MMVLQLCELLESSMVGMEQELRESTLQALEGNTHDHAFWWRDRFVVIARSRLRYNAIVQSE